MEWWKELCQWSLVLGSSHDFDLVVVALILSSELCDLELTVAPLYSGDDSKEFPVGNRRNTRA